jgi:8-oxo-dGTP diphosphatase
MNVARVGVGIIILKGDSILLGKRNDDPSKADSELHGEGTWTCPGGKLEFMENIGACAKREILEETGIRVNTLKLISVTNDIANDAHFITIGFSCSDFDGEPQVKEPDEITEWKWFQLNKLPEVIFLPSKKLINNYLSKTIYKGD